MWLKGNPSAQLVGLQTGVATVENSMEFPQKTKNGIAFWPGNSIARIKPKNPETPIQKNLCTPMFLAAQFTVAKCWKQPKCPSVDEWIKTMVHLHDGILHSRKKEGTPTLHNSMDGSGEHHAKWNNPGSERQIPYDLTYKWNLINKTSKHNITRYIEIKNKLTVTRRERGEG